VEMNDSCSLKLIRYSTPKCNAKENFKELIHDYRFLWALTPRVNFSDELENYDAIWKRCSSGFEGSYGPHLKD
jgi:hypothetical protein